MGHGDLSRRFLSFNGSQYIHCISINRRHQEVKKAIDSSRFSVQICADRPIGFQEPLLTVLHLTMSELLFSLLITATLSDKVWDVTYPQTVLDSLLNPLRSLLAACRSTGPHVNVPDWQDLCSMALRSLQIKGDNVLLHEHWKVSATQLALKGFTKKTQHQNIRRTTLCIKCRAVSSARTVSGRRVMLKLYSEEDINFLRSSRTKRYLDIERYCSKTGCCDSRNDDCHSHYISKNATCYCDVFCDQGSLRHVDCCPDYWTTCAGQNLEEAPTKPPITEHFGKVKKPGLTGPEGQIDNHSFEVEVEYRQMQRVLNEEKDSEGKAGDSVEKAVVGKPRRLLGVSMMAWFMKTTQKGKTIAIIADSTDYTLAIVSIFMDERNYMSMGKHFISLDVCYQYCSQAFYLLPNLLSPICKKTAFIDQPYSNMHPVILNSQLAKLSVVQSLPYNLVESSTFSFCQNNQWQCTSHTCLIEPDLIHYINTGNYGWKADNYSQFWGMTLSDGFEYRLGTMPPSPSLLSMNTMASRVSSDEEFPKHFISSYKWPQYIHRPLDQRNCAASWAFSTASVAADRIAIHSDGRYTSNLSPQHLISCNVHNQNGCRGGQVDGAWWFLRKRGLVSHKCYPYAMDDSNNIHAACNLSSAIDAQGKSYATKPCPNTLEDSNYIHQCSPPYRIVSDEKEIMKEILENGPVQAVMTVHADFFLYKTGIYKHTGLVKNDFDIHLKGTHSVKIVGWGTLGNSEKEKFWIVANSWGNTWGENGYFRIQRGENECGIESLIIAAWCYVNRDLYV
ncbi:tubulointerstitial nephritis antigen [Gastrophryne carolinensis]